MEHRIGLIKAKADQKKIKHSKIRKIKPLIMKHREVKIQKLKAIPVFKVMKTKKTRPQLQIK